MAKRKLEMAVNYYKIADEMTAQSVQMQATLKNYGRYAMTEGERMAEFNSSNDNMIKAMQLREQGDRLSMESSQAGPTHQAAEAVYASTLSQNAFIKMDRNRPR